MATLQAFWAGAPTGWWTLDEAVGAGCQRRGIWEEKNVILHYTLYNPLSYHSQMSKLDTHFPKLSHS